jgi:Xaa-Pro aminopeptidase
MFGSDFFAGNRERLRQLFTGTAPIVITANVSLQKGSDESFPFYQDRSFWYLTGIDEPGVVLVMDKGKEYLILPQRDPIQDLFDGEFTAEQLQRISGIETITDAKDGWRQLGARLKRSQHAATLAANPRFIEVIGLYTNPARRILIDRLKEIKPDLELLDLRPHLMRMRMVKQAPELAAIQRAVDITVESLKDATHPAKMGKYQYEYELEAEFAYGIRRRGAAGHAFQPIVAGGKNACTIHYMENNAPLNENELIVIDVGAGVDHYAADITRTVIAGTASKRQRAVHSAVNEVLEFGLNQLKPGENSFGNAEKELREFMGEKLRELGLVKSIDEDSIRKYYPHAPHYLGLDVHDIGDAQLPLLPGMVLTIEPGIYIPEEGIGVRIEEDILITDTGYEILSKNLPREL